MLEHEDFGGQKRSDLMHFIDKLLYEFECPDCGKRFAKAAAMAKCDHAVKVRNFLICLLINVMSDKC